MLSCEICKIFKKTYLEEYQLATASGVRIKKQNSQEFKYSESRVIVGLGGLVLSCKCAVVGPNNPKYFVGLKFLFVGMSWIQAFSRGCLLGPKLLLVDIYWVLNFFLVDIS